MPTPAADRVVDERLVRALLAEQHPDLAHLPLRTGANGWDNVMFRLGDDLAVRVPRRAAAADLVVHEQHWLPTIADLVAAVVPVPAPLRAGRPSPTNDWPWHWSVVRWIPGVPAGLRPQGVPVAEALAAFVRHLHVPAPAGAPGNPVRGVPLATRTDAVLHRLATEPVPRAAELATAWRAAADVAPYAGPPVWLHGDLHGFNVLVAPGRPDDRLAAVVDFGDLTAGDPACDLATAWLTLGREARAAFRAAVPSDDATWARARGWAVAIASAAAATDDPAHRAAAARAIDAVLDDRGD